MIWITVVIHRVQWKYKIYVAGLKQLALITICCSCYTSWICGMAFINIFPTITFWPASAYALEWQSIVHQFSSPELEEWQFYFYLLPIFLHVDLLAGAVPVVVGAPNIQEFAPSPSSFLHIKELDDIESVAKTMKFLATNLNAYNKSVRYLQAPSICDISHFFGGTWNSVGFLLL